ncbi:hsp70 family protein [Colletotrichum truncatum]|uniref:Hsp70 family protein n=1 Tax=Colletotrichum truncatum TaxID=5467 RepID=A0ACC3Z829_COLTU|nr:hsp70 family protein [Colletotrichum truncatum]KAF6783666.1 hsp70 family protein [Colletotrichum truncatum]
MDPLSIAASAAALAGSAAGLSVWLYELVNNIKNVDSKLSDLSKEVAQLSGLLTSVEKTVKQCQTQALTLAHLDQHMWEQIENTLADCQSNIDGLDRLLIKLSNEYDTEGKIFSRLLKKPSMHFHFTIHKDEVQDYTNKIVKSNCAMQTTLAVVSVSLNFRANVSQESLFQELHKLKGLVEESLRTANRQEIISDPSSARQSRNLERLAKAAKKFHTNASSTASTCYAPERRSSSAWGGSEIGSLSDLQRERIERWNDSNELATVDESTEDSMTEATGSGHGDTSTTFTVPDDEDRSQNHDKQAEQPIIEEDDSDDESDVDLDFLRNFEELAYASFVSQNYSKAEQCLRMAVERSTGDFTGDSNFKQLKMQLALCCCLQEKWDHATGIITSLPKAKSADNLPVLDLLQAIAIANMNGGRLDDAFNTCKTVLQGKKKVFGRRSPQYHECLWLFATIYDKRGHALEAEAVRHSLPRGWKPANEEVLSSPTKYLLGHETLVRSIFSIRDEEHLDFSQQADRDQLEGVEPIRSLEPDSEVIYSGHWKTLVPKEAQTGLRRAEQEDRRGVQIEETDTGKEFVVQSVPGITFHLLPTQSSSNEAGFLGYAYPPVTPPDMTLHENLTQDHIHPTSRDSPAMQMPLQEQSLNYLRAPQSTLPQRPISPKKHGISRSVDLDVEKAGPSSGSSGVPPSIPLRSASQRVSSTKTPFTEHLNELSRSHTQRYRPVRREEVVPEPLLDFQQFKRQNRGYDEKGKAVAGASTDLGLKPTKSINRPLGHTRLIAKVEQAQARSNSVRRRPGNLAPLEEHSPSRPTYIEEAAGELGEEAYSTLEVLPISSPNQEHSNWPGPFSPTWGSTQQIRRIKSYNEIQFMDTPRMRWTVQKDICNIGEARPASQLFSLKKFTPNPGACFVGISSCVKSTSSLALSMGGSGTTICQLQAQTKPDVVPQTPTLGMRDLFRRANLYSRKESPLTDDSGYTVHLAAPRDWANDYPISNTTTQKAQLIGDKKELLADCSSITRRFESEIARIVCREQMLSPFGATSSLRIDMEGLVYALPDFLIRMLWDSYTGELEKSTLMQHAKVIPQSHAIVQYYLDSGELYPESDGLSSNVLVLNCDEKLVECIPYFLDAISPDYAEMGESVACYMAELAGSNHAQAQFAKLVAEQLKLTVREMRRRLDDSAVEDIIQSCCDQFQQKILPEFDNDGREWKVEFEMPSGIPGLQQGRLKFTSAEIWRCFMPSVAMIEEMLEATAHKISRMDVEVSHVLLAGPYSKSKYLRRQLENKLSYLRREGKGAFKLCHSSEGDDICVLGALSHAIGSCQGPERSQP